MVIQRDVYTNSSDMNELAEIPHAAFKIDMEVKIWQRN